MNVSFEDYNTTDAATMLGVQKCTVSYWCRKGYIKYQDVSSPRSDRPRYLFTIDEINRVAKLMDKYGKNAWCSHASEGFAKATKEPVTVAQLNQPVDDTDEITGYVIKIRSLKKQREKLLEELDSLDNAIKTMREKVIAAI